MSTPGPDVFEILSVSLTERSAKALRLGAELTGDSLTDFVNRAIQTYSYLHFEVREEGRTLHLASPDGIAEVVDLDA